MIPQFEVSVNSVEHFIYRLVSSLNNNYQIFFSLLGTYNGPDFLIFFIYLL